MDSEDALREQNKKEQAELVKEWQQKLNRAVEETKRLEQLNAQKELAIVKQNYDAQIDVLTGQVQDFSERVKQLEKELRERDHIIQGKDGEIQ